MSEVISPMTDLCVSVQPIPAEATLEHAIIAKTDPQDLAWALTITDSMQAKAIEVARAVVGVRGMALTLRNGLDASVPSTRFSDDWSESLDRFADSDLMEPIVVKDVKLAMRVRAERHRLSRGTRLRAATAGLLIGLGITVPLTLAYEHHRAKPSDTAIDREVREVGGAIIDGGLAAFVGYGAMKSSKTQRAGHRRAQILSQRKLDAATVVVPAAPLQKIDNK